MQRRQFLLGSAAAALAAPPPQSASPNDRIQIATIGLGNRGAYDTRQALKIPGVQLNREVGVRADDAIHCEIGLLGAKITIP